MLFIDGHVESLTFNKCGDVEVCFVQKLNQHRKTKHIDVQNFINCGSLSIGEVTSAYCSCIGGWMVHVDMFLLPSMNWRPMR